MVFVEEVLDADMEALIAERQEARAKKDFARADAIRDELAAQGTAFEYKKKVSGGHVIDVNLINGIALAFEGDAVHSMYIRRHLIFQRDDQAQLASPRLQPAMSLLGLRPA